MTQGIVFKKAKGEAEDSNGKKIKFSDFSEMEGRF